MNPSEKTFPGRPRGIRAPHGASECTITWPNGEVHRLSNLVLRGFCPCAGCQGHSGQISFQSGRNSDLRDIRAIGNYAIGFVWGDAHDAGIYSFEYLYQLGTLIGTLGEDQLIERQVLPKSQVIAVSSDSE